MSTFCFKAVLYFRDRLIAQQKSELIIFEGLISQDVLKNKIKRIPCHKTLPCLTPIFKHYF